MTDELKLKAIIEKAKGGEWKGTKEYEQAVKEGFKKEIIFLTFETQIIFSHDFLISFFGEKPYHHRQLEIDVHPFHRDEFAPIEVPKWFNWQYHAQQLAITPEEERIDYLYNFL